MWRYAAAPLVVLAVAGGCAPRAQVAEAEEVDGPPAAAESVGLNTLRGDGFSLRYPAGAQLVEDAPVAAPLRRLVRIAGPDIAIRPAAAGANWRVEGAGYVLDVLTYENPDALPAEAWVRRHILSQEALSPPRASAATVAGEAAVRVEVFGGDSQIITLYLARGTRVVGFRYADVPVPNQPIAAVQLDVYALILGGFRWEV